MKKIFYSITLFLCLLLNSSFSENPRHKNGDLIFIVNPSGQGKAIQLATKSEFTHIDIIFIEDGKEMVYHAVEPVSKNTLQEFISMSSDGNYTIKRIKEQSLLSPDKVE